MKQASMTISRNSFRWARAWLALIEETDPATIAEVIGQFQLDANVLDYFTGRAELDNQKKGKP